MVIPDQNKSSSAISRMYNQHDFLMRAFIRALRLAIEKRIWKYRNSIRKRRPVLELILDMTTLEKTGEFKSLPLSYFNDKYGLHVVVLYVVFGKERFLWAIRLWRGKDTTTWVSHALSMLRCLPSLMTRFFAPRVLADTGFGTTQMLEGCFALKLPLVVGLACDRLTKEKRRVDSLTIDADMVFLQQCRVPVWLARFKLKGKNGYFVCRCVVSTVRACGKTIASRGRRCWRIEGFFKTLKPRFGLDQFGQRTLHDVLRFLLWELQLLS